MERDFRATELKPGSRLSGRLITCILLASIVTIVLAALLVYPSFKKIEKRGVAFQDSVSETVPTEELVIAEAASDCFTKRREVMNSRFKHFYLVPASDLIFPSDTYLRYLAKEDASLRPYLAKNSDLRKNDLFLYDFLNYWHSEYYYNDQPAEFKCDFIIHFETESPSMTKIEIFEVGSRIRVGERFNIGHNGPGFYYDIRHVEPTTTDRVELLNIIRQCVSKK